MCCTRLAEKFRMQKIAILSPSHNFVGLYLRSLTVPEMTYNVFSGTLNPTHFTSLRSWGMYRQSEKKLAKHRYLLHMSLYYGELWTTNGWDLLTSLGHPCKFQRLSRLGSVTARHCSGGRQPNFAALNRGRHLYSAGLPSRWALAHILVELIFLLIFHLMQSYIHNGGGHIWNEDKHVCEWSIGVYLNHDFDDKTKLLLKLTLKK